ncbi:hypothetical protein HGI30_14355 [Paenibacillus albicereus]|uniref:Uncharacterized protein n=1 Tax=Paenibacillus albicereus TaxID=2726185 RepID=A0A6H2GYY9_9BACL|nr:hypothetical protein [Paenibacillus albicereus]QJC52630.1 hypothetical protein HGI30_14355 [Paenibacillus albicereus]
MKRKAISLLLLTLVLFVLPVATASAYTSSQITGQGTLVISGSFSGSTADLWVTNQSGQVVFSRAYGSYGGSGTISASVPNLPYGTYTISIGGPALSVNQLNYSFQ